MVCNIIYINDINNHQRLKDKKINDINDINEIYDIDENYQVI